MTLPSSGQLSILDIAKEFNVGSVSLGPIVGTPTTTGNNIWSFTISTSASVSAGDVVLADSFSLDNDYHGIVQSVSYPGAGVQVTVQWRGALSPYNGLSMSKVQGSQLRMSNYYSGGTNVPSGTLGYPSGVATTIPSSGLIKISNFYGASKQVTYNFRGVQIQGIDIPAGTWYVYTYLVGAGGGGGAGDEGIYGGVGGSGGSIRAKFSISSPTTQSLVGVAGLGGWGGRNGGGPQFGGSPGRAYAWSNNVGGIMSPSPWYAANYPSTLWNPDLRNNAVWHTSFTTNQTTGIKEAFSVYFPATDVYNFLGAGDDRMSLYIDQPNAPFANYDGWSTLKTYGATISAGWHTFYITADNSGGAQFGLALGIIRQSNNQVIFSTNGLIGGGAYSGGFWFLNGGSGGVSGSYGSSGSGGGGGAATGLLWYPSGNYLSSNNYNILGIAPGGGGGCGTGRNFNPVAAGGLYLSNWDNRGSTTNPNTVLDPSVTGSSNWWYSPSPGLRVPYNTFPTLFGHGRTSNQFFYAPGADGLWTDWDGGAGGGGGAPWGKPGGYAERPNQTWIQSVDKYGTTTWYAPSEISGAGGNQGFALVNSAYVLSSQISTTNSWWPGGGGGGGYNAAGLNAIAGNGQGGAFAVRISNVDDNVWPTI